MGASAVVTTRSWGTPKGLICKGYKTCYDGGRHAQQPLPWVKRSTRREKATHEHPSPPSHMSLRPARSTAAVTSILSICHPSLILPNIAEEGRAERGLCCQVSHKLPPPFPLTPHWRWQLPCTCIPGVRSEVPPSPRARLTVRNEVLNYTACTAPRPLTPQLRWTPKGAAPALKSLIHQILSLDPPLLPQIMCALPTCLPQNSAPKQKEGHAWRRCSWPHPTPPTPSSSATGPIPREPSHTASVPRPLGLF